MVKEEMGGIGGAVIIPLLTRCLCCDQSLPPGVLVRAGDHMVMGLMPIEAEQLGEPEPAVWADPGMEIVGYLCRDAICWQKWMNIWRRMVEDEQQQAAATTATTALEP